MTITSERIKQRRRHLNMNQETLAEKINVTQVQVSKYERATSYPSIDALILLTEALDTTADYLLGLTDDPNRDGGLPFPYPTELQQEILALLNERDEDFQRRLLDVIRLIR